MDEKKIIIIIKEEEREEIEMFSVLIVKNGKIETSRRRGSISDRRPSLWSTLSWSERAFAFVAAELSDTAGGGATKDDIDYIWGEYLLS